MIELHAVSKFYDTKVAVDRLDLQVDRGSVFGLIGPNGAGKTTTLRMLATLSKPDLGRITLDGLDIVEDVREVRRRIGYMPDLFGSFRGLDCEDYLRYFGRCHGYGRSDLDARVEEVLELTDLRGVRQEPANALSTGMRQRLSLAKTLLHDPNILFLDEPASGLDPRARIEIRMMLRELARLGKTIVISSHILSDLEEICTEVGMIEQGRLVWSGSLEQVQSGSPDVLRCSVEVAEERIEEALAVLRALEGIRLRNHERRRIELEMDGRRGDQVLRALLDARIEVQTFALERVRLEDLFLERTQGIVS